MSVDYTTEENVAFIELKRPPVNSLDRMTREQLVSAIHRAAQDPTVVAVVLWGGVTAFCAGADISEFAGGTGGSAFAEPTLGQVVDTVEACPKPVVAAIAGVCMGGGLELALGCHDRVISENARLALPEVRLGLLPGAGGTQRLPRLIGVANALPLILSGNSVGADHAIALGIGDRAKGDNLRAAAASRARDLAGETLTDLRSRPARLPDGVAVESYFEAQRGRLRSALPAPRRCIDAVRAAVTLDFDEGMRFEGQCFRELIATPESKALQYAFFSDRRAAMIDGLPSDAAARQVRVVGIVGAGTMGTGIALCTLITGLPTVLIETRPKALEQSLARISATFEASIEKGRMSLSERDRRMSSLKTSNDYAALRDADLIIEAVFEDLKIKQDAFRALDRVAGPDAILASNTSSLDIDRIAAFTERTDRVIGLHFFSPANVMRLLEVVRSERTSPSTLLTAMALAKKIGKTAVVARVCDGFIGNRMFEEYLRQAYFLLDEGATPIQVDRALEHWGMAMGPFAVMDLAGGDIGWAIRKRRAVEQPDRPYSKLPDRICELGRFGQKTGAGYYKYDAQGTRIRDPEIEQLIASYARDVGVRRRDLSDEEIVSRLILALVNEGAKLLAEGIAQRGSDVDVVYRHGYGFPAHRGGPLFYADELGLLRVLDRMEGFRQGYQGQLWTPATLLLQCAQRGTRLSGVIGASHV